MVCPNIGDKSKLYNAFFMIIDVYYYILSHKLKLESIYDIHLISVIK